MMLTHVSLLLFLLPFVLAAPCIRLPFPLPHKPRFTTTPISNATSSLNSTTTLTATTIYATITDQLAGLAVSNDVSRFTVPYAQSPTGSLRFANPVQPVDSLAGYNISQTPSACPQQSGDPRGGNPTSEDCLYATYYMPRGAKQGDNLPVFVWTHGGSGISGSSTAAGLDGTSFVESNNVIVVLLQYRLGIFGWLQTNETFDETNGGAAGQSTVAGNQAMRDVVMALAQVNSLVPLLGGDTSKVTLMGQSSGATMVRAILTTPSANNLFTHAVLVSDTADYGLSTVDTNNILGEYAMDQLGCDLSNITCAREASVDDLVYATLVAYGSAPADNPSISTGTPWRAMIGSFVHDTLQTGGVNSSIPIIMTTVANEAGSVTSDVFQASSPNATTLYTTDAIGDEPLSMTQGLSIAFGDDRASVLANDTQVYPVDENVQDGFRETYETVSTDGLWRCSNQWNARQ
jgi:carboxylesterase type B